MQDAHCFWPAGREAVSRGNDGWRCGRRAYRHHLPCSEQTHRA